MRNSVGTGLPGLRTDAFHRPRNTAESRLDDPRQSVDVAFIVSITRAFTQREIERGLKDLFYFLVIVAVHRVLINWNLIGSNVS